MNLKEQISRISELMDINEQNSSNVIIPSEIYSIISKIESKYSYTQQDTGKVMGRQFSGKEKDDVIKQYISDTIGADCWNRLNDKFKSQIYSFCFQSDSDIPYKMKFVAGLANAINPKIARGNIVGKQLSDPNVQEAIKIIKNTCNSADINNYYQNYLAILNEQYKSMDYNNNYQNVWRYRPIAIDKIMNGQDINAVIDGWNEKVLPPAPSPNKKTDGGNTGSDVKKDVPPAKNTPSGIITIDDETLKVDLFGRWPCIMNYPMKKQVRKDGTFLYFLEYKGDHNGQAILARYYNNGYVLQKIGDNDPDTLRFEC